MQTQEAKRLCERAERREVVLKAIMLQNAAKASGQRKKLDNLEALDVELTDQIN